MCAQKCFFFEQGVCTDNMDTLFNVKNRTINSKCFPGASSLFEVLLLCDDRFFQRELSLLSTFVCSTHKQTLSKEYRVSSYRKCWLCTSLQKSSLNVSQRNINAVQALTIFEKFRIRHSYGKTICSRCRQLLLAHVDSNRVHGHLQAFKWIRGVHGYNRKFFPDSTDDDDDEEYQLPSSLDSDEDDQLPPVSDFDRQTDLEKKKRELLNEFLHLCGSHKKIQITYSYSTLKKQSKANFLSSTRYLLHHIFEFLAGTDYTEVQREIFMMNNAEDQSLYDRKITSVMQGISEAYEKAENWATRRSILSIVAPKINFSVLQIFIPGITYYRFLAARAHAATKGTGVIIQPPTRIVLRYDYTQVEHFIDFITSSYVCTDIPFGQRTLVLSDGTKLYVPDTIRNCDSTRIIQQYYNFSQEFFPNYPVLHESTLFKILSECGASTRRALTGLNYFAANGSEAFDCLIELINSLLLDKNEHRRLVDFLRRGKQYLKTDFKINVAREARVRDHCICYSLSDSISHSFSQSCSNHEHDQICSECSYLAQSLQDVRLAIENNNENEEEKIRKMHKFSLAYDSIYAWKSHLLRSINQDLGRECVLDILGTDGIYLNLDFAMKWLPAKYREAQSDFFGKRGVSWHITVVSRRKKCDLNNAKDTNGIQGQNNNPTYADEQTVTGSEEEEDDDDGHNPHINLNDFEHTVFVHVLDQCAQDSQLVVAIIADIMKRLKASDDSIEQACLRCDNAACYHSSSTILSIPTISQNYGISIRRVDFCDPQGGKGSSDRFAAVIKSHVRRYLNEKHDVVNAEQFVQACKSYGGIRNVNVIECQFMPARQSATFHFENIKKFRNFCFERDGIRVFRAWNIGKGNLFLYKNLIHGEVNISLLDLIQPSSVITFGSSINNNSLSKSDKNLIVENTKSAGNQNSLYDCPEDTCICTFVKYGNLLRHLEFGHHRKMAERTTLLDSAKKIFHEKLEKAENKRIISLSLDDSMFDLTDFDRLPSLKAGWALPVTRVYNRFNSKQKQYLDKKYNDGVLHGQFWKPETVVSQMQQEKTPEGEYVFTINEWLTTSQVRSYFSRITSGRSKRNNQSSVSNSGRYTQSSFENSNENEEQYSDTEGNEQESFRDDLAIREAIERRNFTQEIDQLVRKSSTEKRQLLSNYNDTPRRKRSATPQNRNY